MDHESARACFTGYHDGELSEGDRRSLEEHLAACPGCAAEWDSYRRTMEEVSGLRVMAPPEHFEKQVALAIALRGRRRTFGGLSLVGVRIAVLSLVLIMLLIMGYLTYLLLFAEPDPKTQPVDGATKHTQGDIEVIGPVHIDESAVPE
ncbi:MAG: zf-HC2 domain-containing protein [Proteobacteria bacterium]|nr:zf-HC2 domain-containing protein [Pseudomonadota bacterium]